jgi:hypothetical protein
MEENILVNGEALSTAKFKTPSRDFGIMPFWFWNGEMSYEEMEYQLREYYDKGIPGIHIHARFGVKEKIGYLSEDWFDRVKFTVEKAQEIGLQVWVYDEYNWPSGTANNEVQKQNPELTQRYLELVEVDIPGQFFTFLEGTDSRYHDLEQSEPIFACAILTEDLKNGVNNYIDLMPSLSFDKVITWEAPKGPWKLFYFIERKASWYTDVLDKETTKKFLEMTHERYKETMNGSFEGNIKGFYTDEPAMHYFTTGKDNPIVPWSRKMFRIFKDANGYDLKKHLIKLFYDLGEDTAKVRFDFWSALSKQYEEAYYKQIADWCDENDVVFTGHLLYEEWLRKHARTGGNLFHMLRHMDMIGVDHLYPRIGTREMPDEHVALKLASSAAHQFGSTRLLCESLGGIYWDATMERMKWIADWEYVLGVNLFNPHGFHYSIEGERKRDWPPSQFYHHTWWKDYTLFNDYMSRMGYILSGGKHIAKIAILYPLNSIWTNYTPQATNAVGNAIEFDFNYLTDTLLRLHVDFDYIDEDVMRDAVVKDGKICIRDEEYSLLLLPPVTHIKESTLKTMEELYQSGGSVMGDAILPYDCLEGDKEGFTERIEKLFQVSPIEVKKTFDANSKQDYSLIVNENIHGGKVVFIDGPGLYVNKPMEVLKEAVLKCVTPEIEIDSEEVFYLHRVKDGKDFFFIINPVEDGREINVTITENGRPELWNLENGDILDMPVFQRNGEKVSFKLSLEPYGSAMVSFSEIDQYPHIEKTNITITSVSDEAVHGYGRMEEDVYAVVNKEGQTVELRDEAIEPLSPIGFGNEWEFATDHENALLVNNWKVAIDEDEQGEEKGYYLSSFDDANWMDYRMGAWEMQLPEERDEKVYPVALWYRTTFEAEYIPEDLKLLIDGFKGSSYELYINDQKVNETPERSYLDAEIKAVPIKKYVDTGMNSVVVRIVVNTKSDGILDLLKITGDFALRSKEDQYIITAPKNIVNTGSWTVQGYPFFSGAGDYTQTITVDEAYNGKVLKLKVECGKDVAEVWVNGQKVGVRLWNPYEFDLTSFLHAGENTVTVKITNTLINVLEAVEQASGVFNLSLVPYDTYEFKLSEVVPDDQSLIGVRE